MKAHCGRQSWTKGGKKEDFSLKTKCSKGLEGQKKAQLVTKRRQLPGEGVRQWGEQIPRTALGSLKQLHGKDSPVRDLLIGLNISQVYYPEVKEL